MLDVAEDRAGGRGTGLVVQVLCVHWGNQQVQEVHGGGLLQNQGA
jgi:hypothetical protein